MRAYHKADIDKPILRSANTPIILLRTCGVHHCVVGARYANRKNVSFGCHLCDDHQDGLQKGSQLERDVDQILRTKFPKAVLITQPRVVFKNGGTDFEIVFNADASIFVEADGKQHMNGKYKNTTAEAQKLIDERKDQQTLKAGQRLVRLHYLDKDEWEYALEDAIKLIDRPFVIYSATYRKADIVSSP